MRVAPLAEVRLSVTGAALKTVFPPASTMVTAGAVGKVVLAVVAVGEMRKWRFTAAPPEIRKLELVAGVSAPDFAVSV